MFEDFFPQFPLLNLLRAEFDRHNSVSGKKTEETNGQINDIRSGSSRARGVRVDKRQIPPGKVGLSIADSLPIYVTHIVCDHLFRLLIRRML